MKTLLLFYIGFFLIHSSNAIGQERTKAPPKRHISDSIEYGIASYYGGKFQGRLTTSGEKFDQNELTAAHNRLPLGTWVRVTNLKNNRSVIVKITDRMHPKNKRLIDLSRRAAEKLGFIKSGLTKVKVEVLSRRRHHPKAKK
jgi:rare lipoprotein A